MHLLFCAHRVPGLLKNLIAVLWMHGNVAIAMEDDGRDKWPITRNCIAIGTTA
jgi:hypothetical protein